MTEELLRLLLSQGVLGVICVLFILLYLRERKEHNTTRTEMLQAANALQERAAGEKAALHAQHVAVVKELNAQIQQLQQAHADEQQEMFEQINDLREAHAQRERACLQTVEYFAEQEVKAVEELARIAALLRRAYEAYSRR